MTAPAKRSTDDAVRLPPDHHHRDVIGGGWLRPALFGVMDGLVSNTSLIAGVAGGGASGHTVTLTGLAGLVAGACSMAAGEYTSVRGQSEATLAEVAMERVELRRSPRTEQAELAEAYRDRGLTAPLADQVAAQLMAHPDRALRAHTQVELGVDIDRLPSPWVAAGSSLVAFGLGAFVPLAPYALGFHYLWITLVVAGFALFGAGVLASRFTDRSALYTGSRQLLLGALAAALTYGVGQAVGTGVT